jgi:phosphopantothenoylcysteine decarboxylase/phosphopantothenate--cysteine ligase
MNAAPKRTILITAGPTHEPIDEVRYLANRSSGRMGIALAEEAAHAGHSVTLLLGPTHLAPEGGSPIALHRFRTTADLQAALQRLWPEHDVLIMAAAVADYRPAAFAAGTKLRRSRDEMVLRLESTPDLLAALAPMTRPDQTAIGFALEPADRLESSARSKLKRKRLDAIVANPLETMDAPTVTARVYLRSGDVLAPATDLPKADFARWLIERLSEIAGPSSEGDI